LCLGIELVANLYQRFILSLLAFDFGSDFRFSVDWLSGTDECEWDGVTCDLTGKVIMFELGKIILSIKNFLT
jgi:hypothetical protein